MKNSRLLVAAVLLLHVASIQAEMFSLGLVGLGAASLIGLKLYCVAKMLGSALRSAEAPAERRPHEPAIKAAHDGSVDAFDPAHPNSIGLQQQQQQQHRGVNNADLLTKSTKEWQLPQPIMVLPVAYHPHVPVSARVRRALPGGMRLSPDLFRWLNKIDDEECIHRYFCDLGANPRAFGSLGRLTGMMIMMGGLPEDGWAARMHQLGRQSGAGKCPATCNEQRLQRTVAYLERRLFESDDNGAAPAKNNGGPSSKISTASSKISTTTSSKISTASSKLSGNSSKSFGSHNNSRRSNANSLDRSAPATASVSGASGGNRNMNNNNSNNNTSTTTNK